MDELYTKINNPKAIKRDSNSLTHFATTIACYVSVMEDNIGCPVLESVEAPFLMFQLSFCQNSIRVTIQILVEKWKEKEKKKLSPT